MKELSREELKQIKGGVMDDSGDGHCKDGPCNLFVRALGITVTGTCTDFHDGGSVRCSCVNGEYQTDPGSWSNCNVTGQ